MLGSPVSVLPGKRVAGWGGIPMLCADVGAPALREKSHYLFLGVCEHSGSLVLRKRFCTRRYQD